MADWSVPWGTEELALPIPDHWSVVQTATPQAPSAPSDWADRLAGSLVRPEGSPPLPEALRGLGAGGKILLVLEDVTRHSPLKEILPVILREVAHAGIADDRVSVLIATGMHPPMSAEQVREKIGPLADRFAWHCNDASDKEAHVCVGEVPLPQGRGTLAVHVNRRLVEADLRIVVASVTPHLQAGFGGGAKMFVPGCAGLETISQVHLLGLPRGAGPLVGVSPPANPMRGMIDAVSPLIDAAGGRTFAVQYLLDAKDLPYSTVAGDIARGQQMLAKQCAAASGIVMESQADILITNAHPRDYDLWQCFKCIPNTHYAARKGGVIIVLARCPAGTNMGRVRWPLSPKWTRRLIRGMGVKGIVSLVRRLMPGVNPEAHFFVQIATETLHRNPILMYAPEILRRGQNFPGLPLFDNLAAVFRAADEALGEGSRRVAIFPSGGVTYPVLPA
jgi:lactate racemase